MGYPLTLLSAVFIKKVEVLTGGGCNPTRIPGCDMGSMDSQWKIIKRVFQCSTGVPYLYSSIRRARKERCSGCTKAHLAHFFFMSGQIVNHLTAGIPEFQCVVFTT